MGPPTELERWGEQAKVRRCARSKASCSGGQPAAGRTDSLSSSSRHIAMRPPRLPSPRWWHGMDPWSLASVATRFAIGTLMFRGVLPACHGRKSRKGRGDRNPPPSLHHEARRKARPPFRSLNSGLASRSGFVRVEVRLQDLLDPVADLLEVKSRQVLGVRRSRLHVAEEDDVTVAQSVEGFVLGPQDHLAEPLDVFALEVAADGRDGERRRATSRSRQLGEDPVGERSEDLGDLERIRAGVALQLLVLDSLEHARVEALIEDDLLEVEDRPVDRVVRPAEKVVSAVLPRLGDQLAEQGWRELERLVGEDLVDQHLQRLALFDPADRRDGIARLLGSLEVAIDRLPADVFRGEISPVAVLADTRAEGAAKSGPRFVIADHFLVKIL